MCGILVELSRRNPPQPQCTRLLELNSRRGPDSLQTRTFKNGDTTLRFTSTVLSLRGRELTAQPMVEEEEGEVRSVMCWNGEAWRVGGEEVEEGVNDTGLVWERLKSAARNEESTTAILKALGEIEGPYAFVFYEACKHRVWFGRDCLGRRSLVRHDNEEELQLSSTGVRGDQEGPWNEVEADGVYYVDLTSENLDTQHIPYSQSSEVLQTVGPKLNGPSLLLNDEEPRSTVTPLTEESPSVVKLHEQLLTSIRLRVQAIPTVTHADSKLESPFQHDQSEARVAVLFSGGLDCTVLARLVHEVLPSGEPIDLLNVAFENKRVVQAAASGKGKGKKGEAVQETSPPPDPYAICPDRITALKSFSELQATCPTRPWRLIKINIPFDEVLTHKPTVLDLLYPHNTQMDLSIGLAFYFASRGSGILGPSDTPYSTTARVLLSGLGADELFGGYQRHATAHRRGGFKSLIQELQLDVSRLGKRNLGRDDRVLSHWGKETRFPFLDERLVEWALSLPVWEKCSFGVEGLPEDEAGKSALRMVARRLGMRNVSSEKKRAIQFGARSAKMDILPPGSGKVRGTDALD